VPVHIYAVLHDEMTEGDLLWLKRLRDEIGVAFLRFILPRPFGRFSLLTNEPLLSRALSLTDDHCSVKTESSRTRFVTVDGFERMSS
jgi:hypothetical protein